MVVDCGRMGLYSGLAAGVVQGTAGALEYGENEPDPHGSLAKAMGSESRFPAKWEGTRAATV